MKNGILQLGLCGLLTANLLLVGDSLLYSGPLAQATEGVKAETTKKHQKTKGKITNISQKAKTIALSKKDKSFFLLKFNEETTLKGVQSSKEFKVGEAVVVEYVTINGENIAKSLKKAIVKLPKGVKEIKTDELSELLQEGKQLALIDARPPAKYAESHIAEAISIPYAKIVKKGDDASKLLEKYKDRQLVFYCGGPT